MTNCRRFIRGKRFFEIEVDDSAYTTRYGRDGERGLEQTKECSSKQEAYKNADRLIFKKLGQGYRELIDGIELPKAAEAIAPIPPRYLALSSGRINETPAGEIAIRTNESLCERDSVSQAWQRLEVWLAFHQFRPNRLLNTAASVEELADFEERIGFPLPTSLRESYLIHNGQSFMTTGVLYGFSLLPLQKVDETLANWRSLPKENGDFTSFPKGAIKSCVCHSKWLPIAKDFEGNYLVVDLSPEKEGRAGQVLVLNLHEKLRTVLAFNWAQFLTDIADELERGNFAKDDLDPNEPSFSLAWPTDHNNLFEAAGCWSKAKLARE